MTPAPEDQLLQPRTTTAGHRLPRKLADGAHWMGECFVLRDPHGTLVHSYTSVFLAHGTERSMIIDAGHPNDWAVIERHIDEVLASGAPPVEWLFPTHAEVVHAGNLGRLLDKFPAARVCGDVHDLHLYFPDHVDRFDHMAVGDTVDLGGREIVFVDAVFRDLTATLWAYDNKSHVLYTGDGVNFGHTHSSQVCGRVAEEDPDTPIADLIEVFTDYSMYWTRLKRVEPFIERLDKLIDVDFDVEIIAPAHGAPVTEPKRTMPQVREGLLKVAAKLA